MSNPNVAKIKDKEKLLKAAREKRQITDVENGLEDTARGKCKLDKVRE